MRINKIILSALVVGLLASCSKDNEINEELYGKIVPTITQDFTIEAATTRSDDESTVKEKEFTYRIKNENGQYINNEAGEQSYTYEQLTNTFFLPGTYIVEAENCTEDEADAANDNWGKERYYGETSVVVKESMQSNITIDCTVDNSIVTVNYDKGSLEKYFNEGYYAVVTDGNKSLSLKNIETETSSVNDTDGSLSQTILKTNKNMYFKKGSYITLTLHGVLKNGEETYYGPLIVQADSKRQTLYNVTVKANSDKGYITLTTVIKGDYDTVDKNIEFDPFPDDDEE